MSPLIRVFFALQICLAFVAGCVVDDDDAADTELSESSDVAAPALGDDADATDGSVIIKRPTNCASFRLNNRATAAQCSNLCLNRGQNSSFSNSTKVCRCCTVL